MAKRILYDTGDPKDLLPDLVKFRVPPGRTCDFYDADGKLLEGLHGSFHEARRYALKHLDASIKMLQEYREEVEIMGTQTCPMTPPPI